MTDEHAGPAVGFAKAFTWALDDDQDEWETGLFHARSRARTIEAIQRHARSIDDAALEAECRRVQSAPTAMPTTPDQAWALYFGVLAAGSRFSPQQRTAIARRILARLSPEHDGAIDTSAGRDRPRWAVDAMSRLSRQFVADQGHDPEIELGSPYADRANALLREAVDALELTWPAAARNVARLVRDVVWFDAPTQESSTDPAAFGAVFANPKPDWDVPRVVEVLLHEAGHLGLYIKLLLDPLVRNPATVTESAFRPDPRPISGSLHAAFVLVRMVHGLRAYVASDAPVPAKDHAEIGIRELWPRLVGSMRILDDNAVFTEHGAALFGSLMREYEDLRADLGRELRAG